MTNLTAAKVAGATQEVFEYFTEASDAINMGLPPEFQGIAKREVFYAVDKAIQQGESVEVSYDDNEIKSIYETETNRIINKINTQRRSSALKTVNSITNVKVPVINTQAEYDALPSGAQFVEDGITYRKP
jgi:hypothetical protein